MGRRAAAHHGVADRGLHHSGDMARLLRHAERGEPRARVRTRDGGAARAARHPRRAAGVLRAADHDAAGCGGRAALPAGRRRVRARRARRHRHRLVGVAARSLCRQRARSPHARHLGARVRGVPRRRRLRLTRAMDRGACRVPGARGGQGAHRPRRRGAGHGVSAAGRLDVAAAERRRPGLRGAHRE